ncbi:phage tail tape measure protein [Paenibacillus planticolens]|uniref:Phage tail tape measure protein n=1 Tax=Paenibacillus planticolens TaxID=2654976 RepID=A0ABX1ZMM3_9BACL|nr:phage tail tape measure protein [Paenibacillus planticolens]NOV01344.1 phage tail tape measure protein [Paenibacillus planticolens]
MSSAAGANQRVSITFSAVNLLSPEIKRMTDNVKKVKQQMQSLGSGPNNGAKFFEAMNKGMQQASKGLDELKSKFDKMKSAGFGDIATGAATVAPLIATIKKAGEVQMQEFALSGVYNLNMTSEKLKDIRKQAQDLSGLTLFSQKDILGIGIELARAQISQKNLKTVLPEATYVAEMEVLAKKTSSPERSAYNFARMAEDARITNDSDKLEKFADSLFRVVNVTHASSESLGETFKYAMPVVKNLGWDENDMLDASALAAVNGMEGSMAGTHIKDFAERINPYKFLGTRGGQKQLDAMNDVGLLDGVTTDKKGKILGFQGAALLKDKDHIKKYSDMVDVLTEKHKEFIKAGNSELEWAAKMNHIFGEQGQDFAIITSHKEMFDKVKGSTSGQKSLHENITTARSLFEGELHALKSKFEGLGLAIGDQLLPEATKFAHELGPMVASATTWVNTHKDLVSAISKGALEFGGFMLVLGSAKLAIGTIGSLVISPLVLAAKGLSATFSTLSTKAAVSKALPAQAIQANIVNVYGRAINGGAAGAAGGSGTTVAGGGLPPRSSRSSTPGRLSTAVGASASVLKGAGSRAGVLLPVGLAMGAYDVTTAPEGHKMEAAAKASGTVIGGWAGAEAGAALGAAIGSVVPGLGTVIGGILGGIIGGVAGSAIGNKLADSAVNAFKGKTKALTVDRSDPMFSWLPKIDTSKYENQQSKNASGVQKAYQDNSTNHIYVTSPEPDAAARIVFDEKANVSRLRWLAENGQ